MSRRPRPVEQLPEPVSTATDHTGAVEARIDVDRALQELPEEFRVAVVLRDLCDLDYAEIAAVLEIPPGTVRSRISRGRSMLTAALGRDAGPDPRPGNSAPPVGRRSADG